MKKVFCIFLSLVLLALSACTTAIPAETGTESVLFTDSLGREVAVPAEIETVAATGPMAQIVLFALCPDKLAGIANEWNPGAEDYLDPEYYELPVLGQLYGGRGELNVETLLASGAQIVIDVGEAKDGTAEDLDELSAQTGIPFVHIDAATAAMGDCFRMLGELLDMSEPAETLARYCEDRYAAVADIAARADKKSLLYCLGDEGLNVIARDSYHSEILDLLSDNAAVVEQPSGKGTGNETDMEQLLLWDPEVILFPTDSVFDTVGEDPAWRELSAIASGQYYEVPYAIYNWMGFPPSVQRWPGMLWLGKLLYPELADYDLYEEVQTYYNLFYHCDMSREQFDALTENSLGRQAES